MECISHRKNGYPFGKCVGVCMRALGSPNIYHGFVNDMPKGIERKIFRVAHELNMAMACIMRDICV